MKTTKPLSEPKPPFKGQRQSPPGLESELDPLPQWKGERYRPADKLRDHTALITGGDSGIGRSVAYHFAREGADVTIACLPEELEDAKTVQDAIHGLGRRCLIVTGDLAEADVCDRLIDETIQEYGHIDTLVQNVAWQNRKDIEDLSEHELDTTLKVNVYAYLRLARGAVPHMRKGSSIIATGSVVGLSGSPRLSDYGATKGAIHAITRSLALELHEKGIRVNCVAPGPVWTPLNPAERGLMKNRSPSLARNSEATRCSVRHNPRSLPPPMCFSHPMRTRATSPGLCCR